MRTHLPDRDDLVAFLVVALTAALLTLLLRVPAARAEGPAPICVLLVANAGVETLVNRCAGCREVTIERTRPGDGTPTMRQVTLPGGVPLTLPFRGPGRTRIVGERVCAPPPGQRVAAN